MMGTGLSNCMGLGQDSPGSHMRVWETFAPVGFSLPIPSCCLHLGILCSIKAVAELRRHDYKTLESPLDSKEVKPVNPKGNQPQIFIGKTDAEA